MSIPYTQMVRSYGAALRCFVISLRASCYECIQMFVLWAATRCARVASFRATDIIVFRESQDICLVNQKDLEQAQYVSETFWGPKVL
jgi:hypothetical protein